MDVVEAESRGDFWFGLDWLFDVRLRKYSPLFCGHPDEAASFCHQVHVGEQFPQIDSTLREDVPHFLLNPLQDESQQILVAALALEELEDLDCSFDEFLGKFYFPVLAGAVAAVPVDDGYELEVVWVGFVAVVREVVGDAVELLHALLQVVGVVFYDLV